MLGSEPTVPVSLIQFTQSSEATFERELEAQDNAIEATDPEDFAKSGVEHASAGIDQATPQHIFVRMSPLLLSRLSSLSTTSSTGYILYMQHSVSNHL